MDDSEPGRFHAGTAGTAGTAARLVGQVQAMTGGRASYGGDGARARRAREGPR